MSSVGDHSKSWTASSFKDFLSRSPMSGVSYTLMAFLPRRARNLQHEHACEYNNSLRAKVHVHMFLNVWQRVLLGEYVSSATLIHDHLSGNAVRGHLDQLYVRS